MEGWSLRQLLVVVPLLLVPVVPVGLVLFVVLLVALLVLPVLAEGTLLLVPVALVLLVLFVVLLVLTVLLFQREQCELDQLFHREQWEPELGVHPHTG